MSHLERNDAVDRTSDPHPCDSEFEFCPGVFDLASVHNLCMKNICPVLVKRFEQFE